MDSFISTASGGSSTSASDNTTAVVQTWWLVQLICRLTFNLYSDRSSNSHTLECVYNDTMRERYGDTRHRLYYRCGLLQEREDQAVELSSTRWRQISAECQSTHPPLSISTDDQEVFDLGVDFPRNVTLKLTNDTTTTEKSIAAYERSRSLIWLTIPKFPLANVTVDKEDGDKFGFEEARLECRQAAATATQASDEQEVLLCNLQKKAPDHYNDPSAAEGVVAYDWTFLFVIVFIVAGGVGNVLVCLAVCLDRRLQNVTNYFLLSLAIADLLVCLFVMPLGAIQGFFGYWPLGTAWCNVYVSCDVLACSSSIMHMCCISLGRYLGIRNPLKTRHKYATKRLVGMKIALVWALSLAVSGSVTFLGLHNSRNIMPEPRVCAINNRAFFVFGSLVAFYIPMLIMVVTYALTVQLLQKKARFLENKTETGRLRGNDTFRRIGGRFRRTESTVKTATTVVSSSSERLPTTFTSARNELPAAATVQRSLSTRFNRNSSTTAGSSSSFFKTRRPIESTTSSHSQSSLSDALENSRTISTISESMNRENGEQSRPPSLSENNTNNRKLRLKSLRLQLSVKPTSIRFLTTKNKRQNVALAANAVRTEQKASKVLGLVFFTFVLCWTPFFVLNIIFAVCPRSHCRIPDHIVDITLWLGYVSSTINPIIYTIFNRTFRNAFIRLLQMKCSRRPSAVRYRSVNDNRSSSALFAQTSSGTPAGVGVATVPLSLSGVSGGTAPLITPSTSTTGGGGGGGQTSKTTPASQAGSSVDVTENSDSH